MKKILILLYVILGVVSIIFGAMSLSEGYYTGGEYISHKSYGGDAYTGIQNAAADAGNNALDVERAVNSNSYAISEGIGYILIVMGGSTILKGFSLASENKEAKEQPAQPEAVFENNN